MPEMIGDALQDRDDLLVGHRGCFTRSVMRSSVPLLAVSGAARASPVGVPPRRLRRVGARARRLGFDTGVPNVARIYDALLVRLSTSTNRSPCFW
jgi:hypothetical protein